LGVFRSLNPCDPRNPWFKAAFQLPLLNEHGYGLDVLGRATNAVRQVRGIGDLLTGTIHDHTFDNIGQLKTARGYEPNETTRVHEQIGYAYDAAHNLTHRTNNAFVREFGLNAVNHLSGATRSGSFTVAGSTLPSVTNVTVNGTTAALYQDGAFALAGQTLADGNNSFTVIAEEVYGRKTTNSFSVNLPSSVSFSHDANGNLTWDGHRAFVYDDENRLVVVQVTDQWRSEFFYDGLDRLRIRKEFTWNGSAWTLADETRFIYDGRLVIQERNASNTPQVSYTRGLDLSGSLSGAGGIGGLLAMTTQPAGSSRQHLYYHSDRGGNVTALSDNWQRVVASYAYDPFGNLTGMSGTMAEVNRYRFSSKELHGPSGLYYYGFRFFDSNLQRWINQDPIGEAGGINLYGFVGNDPLNVVDTDGLAGWALNGPQVYWDSKYRNMVHSRDYQEGVRKGSGMAAKQSVPVIASVLLEPVDWAMTAKEIYEDPKNPWSYAGILPFVPSATSKFGKCLKRSKRIPTQAELDKLYPRVRQRQGVADEVWERSKAPDGKVYDPSGVEIKPRDPWEMGHTPRNKFSDAQRRAYDEGWDRKTWRDYQNDPDIYRPELPRSNRSHRHENDW
jgi:RHS repeat-associated protein